MPTEDLGKQSPRLPGTPYKGSPAPSPVAWWVISDVCQEMGQGALGWGLSADDASQAP